ncbi:hypothetical protein AMTR_s00101p00026570 [Amborella trichopoda]|uniref:Bulb-type lectin domain-containing protein n=1 Tax=Amborella trichopoda TaxID=13333 RepID=W1NTW9_AMBTC|nr:hypothetical protein AMTR_s00101p00026570 [Amborella trichopoda]
MVGFYIPNSIWVLILVFQVMDFEASGLSWCPFPGPQESKFEQKSERYWEYEEKTQNWREITLPFDLKTCLNRDCRKVGVIEKIEDRGKGLYKTVEDDSFGELDSGLDEREETKRSGKLGLGVNERESAKSSISVERGSESFESSLPMRRRTSLTKLSDTSIWVTGESGSIYERFWNGVQWVIAPHDLPVLAGHAVSVFIVNQTILYLSEDGVLYQLQLNENSQPVWSETQPTFEPAIPNQDTEKSGTIQIKSGAVSHNREMLYLSTICGSLLELRELQPPRWINHGHPPGGDVAGLADTVPDKPDVVFIVSSTGELYEFDKTSKPSWKKHIWSEPLGDETYLLPSRTCASRGLFGAHSLSIFLLSKDGLLVERRLHQRKWKWIVHGAPKGHSLSAIGPIVSNELNTKAYSLFCSTTTGSIQEYQLPKHTGANQGPQSPQGWVNHMHPLHAKCATGIQGLQLQGGRILFPLHDGRLGELHSSGNGGEFSGPTVTNIRRKALSKYEWSIIDVPETEGWNAEYCNNERGPSNCISGVKDIQSEEESNESGIIIPSRRRKGRASLGHLIPSTLGKSLIAATPYQYNFLTSSIRINYRMRTMQADKSFFIVTESGSTFEYLWAENVWLWLSHEYTVSMRGVLGTYNGSLFLVDVNGNLIIRERSSNGLAWINCTAMNKGRQVALGPPWDGTAGIARRITANQALFFVSKNGALVQFVVALRKFTWKNCRSPYETKIASIVDQEGLRSNIVFVIGNNGRLYQYNLVTELWHEHDQPRHLILSKLPGTVIRPSLSSLRGSLFMRSEDGGLIEYSWNAVDGPSFEDNQLFVIGSDGQVYRRYMVERKWKWKSYGYPSPERIDAAAQTRESAQDGEEGGKMSQECSTEDPPNFERDAYSSYGFNRLCNEKVAAVRPIPFSDDSVVFELQDGRLAELRRVKDTKWDWYRTISTPTSQCGASYWTASAS